MMDSITEHSRMALVMSAVGFLFMAAVGALLFGRRMTRRSHS